MNLKLQIIVLLASALLALIAYATPTRQVTGPFYSRGPKVELRLQMFIKSDGTSLDASSTLLIPGEVDTIVEYLKAEFESLQTIPFQIREASIKIKMKLVKSALDFWMKKKSSTNLDTFLKNFVVKEINWAEYRLSHLMQIQIEVLSPQEVILIIENSSIELVEVEKKISSNDDQPRLLFVFNTLRQSLIAKIKEWTLWIESIPRGILVESEIMEESVLELMNDRRVGWVDKSVSKPDRRTKFTKHKSKVEEDLLLEDFESITI